MFFTGESDAVTGCNLISYEKNSQHALCNNVRKSVADSCPLKKQSVLVVLK